MAIQQANKAVTVLSVKLMMNAQIQEPALDTDVKIHVLELVDTRHIAKLWDITQFVLVMKD